MKEEVVAKRHNAAGAGYIFVILMGIALVAAGIALSSEETGALVIGLAVGGLLIGTGVYMLVKFFKIPSNAIVYKDGILYLPGKVTCRPEELEKVFIKVYKSRYGVVSRYGKMEISVHGQVYKYNNIAQIQRAQDRLLELNRQAIDRLNQPEQPSETKPAEDPFSV
ncbi:MAG: hypothetical protein K2L12_07865 [Clostridia bacterium]|nr:hypothetical protein [Clostridia bacterium]